MDRARSSQWSRERRFGVLFRKRITDGSHRPDKIGSAGGVESMPKAADVNIDGPGAEMNVARPGRSLKLAAGMDPAGVSHEMDEQAKLGRGEVNETAIAPHHICGQVHFEIAKGQHLPCLGRANAVMQRRTHPLEKFLWRQGSGKTLIGAGGEEFLAMALITRSQKHQDDEGPCLLLKAKLCAQSSHVDAWKPGLEQEDVRLEFVQPPGQTLPVRFSQDLHADLLEDIDDEGRETIVLGGQHDRRRGLR